MYVFLWNQLHNSSVYQAKDLFLSSLNNVWQSVIVIGDACWLCDDTSLHLIRGFHEDKFLDHYEFLLSYNNMALTSLF